MANKVVVQLVDDIDGGPAAETIAFALEGVNYEIDLSAEHAAELRDAFAQWVGNSRRIGGRKTTRAGSAKAAPARSDAGKIREWARSRGIDVSERGRIPAELHERYLREVGNQ